MKYSTKKISTGRYQYGSFELVKVGPAWSVYDNGVCISYKDTLKDAKLYCDKVAGDNWQDAMLAIKAAATR